MTGGREARPLHPAGNGQSSVTEVLFYHLEKRPLEAVLPVLLEKCLERGWRSVVQVGSEQRCRALDSHLWTWREESFLPHAMAGEDSPEGQPVWLTEGDDDPIAAEVRFLVDGSGGADLSGYRRAVFIFDGNDAEALAKARQDWKRAKEAGHDVTYWQQSDAGAWERRA